MARDPNTLLTSEMNKAEWLAFRKQFIEESVELYMCELKYGKKEATRLASFDWENYVGMEAFERHNNDVIMRRDKCNL